MERRVAFAELGLGPFEIYQPLFKGQSSGSDASWLYHRS